MPTLADGAKGLAAQHPLPRLYHRPEKMGVLGPQGRHLPAQQLFGCTRYCLIVPNQNYRAPHVVFRHLLYHSGGQAEDGMTQIRISRGTGPIQVHAWMLCPYLA
ncbi:MAG: hypothetical protein RMK51_03625 [Meiothermus sp.]|nr:hypothetical protein [Meiothermus sp.]MCS7069338.1 hypothetical protein [Meiothermus sp.]MDW8424998.1 hypothetical protein [Meiothermus sp.]